MKKLFGILVVTTLCIAVLSACENNQESSSSDIENVYSNSETGTEESTENIESSSSDAPESSTESETEALSETNQPVADAIIPLDEAKKVINSLSLGDEGTTFVVVSEDEIIEGESCSAYLVKGKFDVVGQIAIQNKTGKAYLDYNGDGSDYRYVEWNDGKAVVGERIS